MQPVHPGDASYARAAELLAGHDFDVAAEHRRAARRERARRLRPAGDRAPLRSRTGSAPPASARRSCTPRSSTRSSATCRAAAGCVVLGETEQDKYGNNVNELLDALRPAACAATPSRTTSTATALRPGSTPSSPTAARGSGGDLLAGVGARLLLPRDDDREPQRRAGAGAHAPLGFGSRRPADGRLRARRRPRGRARRLRPVRRRLHRCARPRGAVVEHRQLGGPAGRAGTPAGRAARSAEPRAQTRALAELARP